MMHGEYSIIITGPAGVALTAVIDLANRDRPASLAMDDERLPELLTLTAICGGCVEGEMVKRKEARHD